MSHLATGKSIACTACKTKFVGFKTRQCSCKDGEELNDIQILKKAYKKGMTIKQIFEAIRKEGYFVSRDSIAKICKIERLEVSQTKYKKRDDLLDYLYSLEERPGPVEIKQIAQQFDCAENTVKRQLGETHPTLVKEFMSRQDKEYLEECYSKYIAFSSLPASKRFPLPFDIVTILPLLKRHKYI